MIKPILCIRNDRYDNLGITESALSAAGVAVLRVDAFEAGERWPALDEIGGLIVFGGEMNVDQIDTYPYLLHERQLMAEAVTQGKPVLGICLGAQMLARALGTRVYRAPVRELGFRPVSLTELGANDPVLGAFGTRPYVFEWHEDTFDVPAGAELLAIGDDVRNQAFRHGKSAWGVQFHFEVDRDGVEAWLHAAASSLERVWKRSADEIRNELAAHLQTQQQQSRAAFASFAGVVRAAA